jgi:tetratricopeptide (TPR) repeat protein
MTGQLKVAIATFALGTITLFSSATISTGSTMPALAACLGTGALIADRLAACTQAIDAGGVPDHTLAALHSAKAHLFADMPGGFAKAAAEMSEALRLEPANTSFLSARALYYRIAGDYDQALADLDRLIDDKFDTRQNFLSRAQIWFEKGDTNKALADIDNVLKESPDDVIARVLRARLLAAAATQKGDYAEAISDLDEALQIGPKYGPLFVQRARLRRLAGDLEGALRDFESLLSVNRADLTAHFERGLVYEAMGKKDLAAADFGILAGINASTTENKTMKDEAIKHLRALGIQ